MMFGAVLGQQQFAIPNIYKRPSGRLTIHKPSGYAGRLFVFVEIEMTFTIEFGWWLLPLAVTVFSYGYAFSNFTSGRGDYSFPDLWNGFLLIFAAVPTLVSWLIWALAA